MGDIEALNLFLNSLGIQGKSNKNVVTSADFTGTGTGTQTRKLSIGTDYMHDSTITDLNVMIPYLTNLLNLKSLDIYSSGITAPSTDSSSDKVKAIHKTNLIDIQSKMSALENIHIYDQDVCIGPNDLTDLSHFTLNYKATSGVFESEQGNLQFCAGVLASTASGSAHNSNSVCKDVDTSIKYNNITLPTATGCSCSGGGGTLCIQSVEIKNSNLVITTESCSPTSSSTLNTPVSESPEISYSSCTSCGNNKTLLRNKVDEVKDDSSLLYNRDSNNEVCNHCLVSIGDEKHCNRFLEKEECNYLGDSYNWVGA